MRVDFDATDRINFSGLKSDPNTFLPLFSKDFKGATENPGLYPAADGWHKLKIEVRNTSATQTSIWCYYDGTLLKGCPIVDTSSNRLTSGGFGLYAFQQDSNGIAGYFDNFVVKSLPATSVQEDGSSAPSDFQLMQNYPNPFNPTTAISYQLVANSFVRLQVFDLLGRGIAALVNGNQAAGRYTVRWDGKTEGGESVSSGIYLYRLEAVEPGNTGKRFVEARNMILLR